MTGTKLYARKARTVVFLLLYAGLAVAGAVFVAQSLSRNEPLSAAAGFMVIFGAGMFILTVVKGRQAQVSVYEDFMELHQSRKKQLVRYRNMVSVTRPDSNRMVITLREDGDRKDVTVWLKELDKNAVDRLADFLAKKKQRG